MLIYLFISITNYLVAENKFSASDLYQDCPPLFSDLCQENSNLLFLIDLMHLNHLISLKTCFFSYTFIIVYVNILVYVNYKLFRGRKQV